MKHKFAAAVMAAAMAAAGLTGCMEKKQPASSVKKNTETSATSASSANDTLPKGEFIRKRA